MAARFVQSSFVALALLLAGVAQAIVPEPVRVAPGAGRLVFDHGVAISAPDPDARRVADWLAGLLERAQGVKAGATAIELVRVPRLSGGPEAYRLEVTPRKATITASDTRGLRNGAATLLQLVDQDGVDAVLVEDAPRFAWRGLMLDSARHYQSPGFIRSFIDWMALHKLNVLHWHLVDDQAWRLEIRKYPKLTSVGAWRVPAGAAAQADIDPSTGKPRLYGGFYSQDEVRGLVAYAADRGITIVPEIEMPGHASAALAAYPELAAGGNPPTAVPADWGIYDDVYGVGDPTFAFLQDVLTETMALFPSTYIHVGGDEVQGTQWAASPVARARMKALGMTDAKELQHDFTQRMATFLAQHGRRLVGWDEILAPGMPSSAVVMSWRGIDGALAATARGNDSVLCPWPTLYFDNRQGRGIDEPPGRTRVVSLEDVYRFEPEPAQLDAAQRSHLLGVQGALWSEHIRTEARLAHMAFPRAAAIAELGWTPRERRDWNGFAQRLPALFALYDAVGVPHADSAVSPQPTIAYEPEHARVALATQAGIGEIRYTRDGSEPVADSPRYEAPLDLPYSSELRAATFAGGQRLSRTRSIGLFAQMALSRTSRELELCSDAIGLSLEDDAPVDGERAVFDVDIMKPCWWFRGANLDAVSAIEASVGQVPFNFRIGRDVEKIVFEKPQTAAGELLVHLDTCDGDVIARLPVAPALASNAVTVLPPAVLARASGRHDLCFRFAQPALEPVWVLDGVNLIEGAP